MQGDLISRSDVINLMYEVFEDYSVATDKQDKLGGFGSKIFERVKELPTAYDVEKVVAELKERCTSTECSKCRHCDEVPNVCYEDCDEALIQDMIDIVFNGGKE